MYYLSQLRTPTNTIFMQTVPYSHVHVLAFQLYNQKYLNWWMTLIETATTDSVPRWSFPHRPLISLTLYNIWPLQVPKFDRLRQDYIALKLENEKLKEWEHVIFSSYFIITLFLPKMMWDYFFLWLLSIFLVCGFFLDKWFFISIFCGSLCRIEKCNEKKGN